LKRIWGGWRIFESMGDLTGSSLTIATFRSNVQIKCSEKTHMLVGMFAP
jgi:hypothetical protein